MRRLALLAADVDRVDRSARLDLGAPAVADALDRPNPHVGDAAQPGLLAHGPLGRLHREAVARAAAVARQVDATRSDASSTGQASEGSTRP